MIGQHPQLYAFPELVLFTAETLEGTLRKGRHDTPAFHSYHHAGLKRAVAQLAFGAQDDEAVRQAEDWIRQRQQWRGVDVLDYLLDKVRPRIGVEKSPDYTRDVLSMLRVARGYPRARFIHLTRHPWTAIRSIARHVARTHPGRIPSAELNLFAAGTWASMHENITAFGQLLPVNNILHLRGEDILRRPDEQCRKVALWLELRTDDEAIEEMMHPERSVYAHPGPAGAIGGNDWLFLNSPALEPGTGNPSLADEQPLELPRSLVHRIESLSAAFGY